MKRDAKLGPYTGEDPPANPGYVWADCLCAEIDPADVPCVVCAVKYERRATTEKRTTKRGKRA